MVYCMSLYFLEFIFDILTVRRLSEQEKEVQILLLRQQLRIVERKQPRAPRLPRGADQIKGSLALIPTPHLAEMAS